MEPCCALQAGLLDLPKRVDGEPRRLEGRAVWAISERCPNGGPSFSVARSAVNGHGHTFFGTAIPIEPTCTRLKLGLLPTQWVTALRFIPSYRWASDESTAAAFLCFAD